VARLVGPWPVRLVQASSPKETSRTFSRGHAVCGSPDRGVYAGQRLALEF